MRQDLFSFLLPKEVRLAPISLCLFLMPFVYSPFFVYSFTQGKELFFRSFLIVSFLVATFFCLKRGAIQLRPLTQSLLFWLLLISACLVVVSSAISPTPIVTLYGTLSQGFGLITQAFLFGFIVFCASVLDRKTIPNVLKSAFAAGVVVALYAILQKFGIDPLFSYYDTGIFAGRVFSFLGNPSYLGQLMALDFIVGVYFLLDSKNFSNKIFFGGGSAIVFFALWFSQTRAALLSLSLCLILVLFRYRITVYAWIRGARPLRKAILFVTALLILVSIPFALPKDRFSFSGDAIRSLNSRFEVWKGAIHLIQKKPWLGYGQETFYIHAPEIVTSSFLTLEEDLDISVDRAHNDLLEALFSYGILGGLLYVAFIFLILKIFLTAKEKVMALLSLVILANAIQNQFSFSDIAIATLIAFCIGGLISFQVSESGIRLFPFRSIHRLVLLSAIVFFGVGLFYMTVFRPFMSQFAHYRSHKNHPISYDIAVNELKTAIAYMPFYSELWYELMFLDPSSIPRALPWLESIEGNSGNVLAWKGNFYSDVDPAKASDYYFSALKKNLYYPNWIRSYADMLYRNGDYRNALYLYKQYLDSSPLFWKWRDSLDRHTPRERASYEVFLKHSPYFLKIVDRVEALERMMGPEKELP